MVISSQPPKTDVPHALHIYHPHFNMSGGFEIPTFIWRKQLYPMKQKFWTLLVYHNLQWRNDAVHRGEDQF